MRNKYTQEQRTNAIALVQTKGLTEAHRELGIPIATLNNWTGRKKAKTSYIKKTPQRAGQSTRDTETITLTRTQMNTIYQILGQAVLGSYLT